MKKFRVATAWTGTIIRCYDVVVDDDETAERAKEIVLGDIDSLEPCVEIESIEFNAILGVREIH